MSSSTKAILSLIGTIILAYIAFKLAVGLLALILKLLVPIIVLGAIGYGLYTVGTNKGLFGGRRTLP